MEGLKLWGAPAGGLVGTGRGGVRIVKCSYEGAEGAGLL